MIYVNRTNYEIVRRERRARRESGEAWARSIVGAVFAGSIAGMLVGTISILAMGG